MAGRKMFCFTNYWGLVWSTIQFNENTINKVDYSNPLVSPVPVFYHLHYVYSSSSWDENKKIMGADTTTLYEVRNLLTHYIPSYCRDLGCCFNIDSRKLNTAGAKYEWGRKKTGERTGDIIFHCNTFVSSYLTTKIMEAWEDQLPPTSF